MSTQLSKDWDAYGNRAFRYIHATHFADNTIYNPKQQTYWNVMRTTLRYYKATRPIYNPVPRLINLTVNHAYGGQLDLENLSGGAIPLQGTNKAQDDAIRQLWIWSNLASQKNLFAYYAATLGDSIIKIIDDTEREKVYMQVLHPLLIQDADFDEFGNVKKVVIAYRKTDPTNKGTMCNYREEIDKDSFKYFKDDKPYDWTGQGAEYENIYGFVPVVHAKYKDVGRKWGACAGQFVFTLIDNINSEHSSLNDHMRKANRASWVLPGVSKGDNPPELTDDPNRIDIIYAPNGSTGFPLVAPIDTSGSLENIQSMIDEVERNAPVLGFARVREHGGDSGVALSYKLADGIAQINETRGNLDAALVRAHKMAMTIGGIRNYDNFQSFNKDSFDNGSLDHNIAERPVIEQLLDVSQKWQLLIQAVDSPLFNLLFNEFGYTKDQIEAVQKKTAERDAQKLELDLMKTENARIAALAAAGSQNQGVNQGDGQPTTAA